MSRSVGETYTGETVPVPVVHIGYHKTATTWLQRRFFPALGDRVAFFGLDRLWDELIAPSPLEFDHCRCRRYVAGQIDAHPGKVCVFSAERLSGNPHSGGYDAKEMANRIEAVFGVAKILILVREQVAMIVSSYKQYVRMGGICSFEEYVAPPRDGRMPLFRLENFCYHRLVEYYVALFGAGRVLVLPYELLQGDRAGFARRVLDYIGLVEVQLPATRGPSTRAGRRTDHIGPDGLYLPAQGLDARVNVSLTDLQTRLKRWVNLLSVGDSLYPVRPRAPWLLARLFGLIDRLGTTNIGRRPSGRFRERAARAAGDRYVSSNRRLQRHVPCDLGSLGYRV